MKIALLNAMLAGTAGLAFHLSGCGACPVSEAFPPFRCDHGLSVAMGPAPTPDTDAASPEAPGTVRTVDEPMREIEGAPTGRIRLLEMYQAAVTQRNQLAQQAADLTRERDATLARAVEAEKKRAELEERQVGLSAELRDLHAKALELARRLAQAELARLQNERAELEGAPSDAGRGRTP